MAVLCRALAADPANLDVLLSLGVSYTNELEQVGAGTIGTCTVTVTVLGVCLVAGWQGSGVAG